MTTRNKITSSIIKAAFALLLAASPALAMQGHGVRAVEQFAFAAVASRDVIVYQGQAVNELLTATGLETSGRGLRAHIRTATPAATVIQILTYNGASNARVAFDGSAGVRMTIGAGVSALWLVGADRTEWVYDVESYSLSDVDDVIVTHRGKFIVYGNRTRESDVTPSAQMPSGDGRYVRFDTDAQGLSDAQKLAARTNIGAGTGGGGAGTWGSITGTLTDQTDLTSALALKAPLASPTFTGTPAAPTAAGATSTTQIATTAFVGGEITTHAGATDPHGDRAFATAADSTHSALTTGAHGITAAGAALLDDATAADQRTTLGLGTAATQASSTFEASGAVSTHNAVTTAHGISAYGATLVDDADAATARTTLGLGTAATAASGDFAAASHNQAASTITSGTLAHERGGLEADVSAYSGLVKIAAGATSAVTVTAAGEALLDDADAAAQRATLGLVIGTNVQAYDADLTTWAGVTPGTGIATALAVNVGSAGAPVINGGALGTPSSGTLTNATGLPLSSGVTGQLPLANGGTGANLTDPGADRIAFWDDSAGAVTWLTAGTGLTITDTTIDAAGGGGSGDVVGPASATDNAIARYDTTTGKLLQDSGVTVSDVSGSSVTVASTAGNALALAATAPAATTGASVAGVATTITAGAAVASTDTAGAAAGGSVTITAGAAARLTSGNANGGNITLTTGAGIGTGTTGQVLVTYGGTTTFPALKVGSQQSGLSLPSGGYLVPVVDGGTVGSFVTGIGYISVSTAQLGWSSGAYNAARDTGLARNAAGVIRATNAGSEIRGFLGGGAAVASATALPVPTGRVFHVTGTTTITSITSTNFASGAVITLIFNDVLTFTDGSNLKLAGNFTTAADSTITLVYDGTNWFETSRSTN